MKHDNKNGEVKIIKPAYKKAKKKFKKKITKAQAERVMDIKLIKKVKQMMDNEF